MVDSTSTPPAVTDRRTTPKGVLPRHLQTWLLMGLAGVVLGIIAFAGRPEPPALANTNVTPVESMASSPGRVRDFQDRLRVIDTQARQDAFVQQPPPSPRPDSKTRRSAVRQIRSSPSVVDGSTKASLPATS